MPLTAPEHGLRSLDEAPQDERGSAAPEPPTLTLARAPETKKNPTVAFTRKAPKPNAQWEAAKQVKAPLIRRLWAEKTGAVLLVFMCLAVATIVGRAAYVLAQTPPSLSQSKLTILPILIKALRARFTPLN